MKTKIHLLFSFIIIAVFLTGCGDYDMPTAPFRQSVNLNMDNYNNLITVIESPNAHSGKKICHLDSGQIYGFIYTLNIPDSLIGKDLDVSIDSWVRTGKKDNQCSIICSVINPKDSILMWNVFDASKVIVQPNEWANLYDKVVIPGNLMVFGGRINIMCFNSQASSYFDVDDLNMTFSEPEKNND